MSSEMEIFAKKLKELRTEKNLTQQQLASILHIKQQSYLRYELGTGQPSLETLTELSKFFDVSTDYLLGLED